MDKMPTVGEVLMVRCHHLGRNDRHTPVTVTKITATGRITVARANGSRSSFWNWGAAGTPSAIPWGQEWPSGTRLIRMTAEEAEAVRAAEAEEMQRSNLSHLRREQWNQVSRAGLAEITAILKREGVVG